MSGHIKRGKMAGDRFTQISNALFRDPRISFKAKGVFGLISTHRDGFGISVTTICKAGKEGPSAVRSALTELEEHGYLEREQAHDRDGKFGEAVYTITDMPAHLYELYGDDAPELPTQPRRRTPSTDGDETGQNKEEGRSAPTRDFPRTDNPSTDEPHAADRTHKKSTSKKTNLEEDQSLSPACDAPPAAPPQGPATSEKETASGDNRTDDSPDSPAARQAADVQRAYTDAYRTLHGVEPLSRNIQLEATALLTAATPWPLDHLKRLAAELPHRGYTSLARHAEHNPPPAPARVPNQLPPPCAEHVGPDLPMRTITTDTGELRRCPRCHPYSPAYQGPA